MWSRLNGTWLECTSDGVMHDTLNACCTSNVIARKNVVETPINVSVVWLFLSLAEMGGAECVIALYFHDRYWLKCNGLAYATWKATQTRGVL